MKIAYLDTVAGIAGDMTMAAFVSAGLPFEQLRDELRKLHLDGFELIASRVTRNAISAVHIDVVIPVEPHLHRTLAGIQGIIDASDLDPKVKETARNIFLTLARAEAKLHGTTVEQVHFHEVGALDSIVDVVGAALCFHLAGIERVYTSPVRLGASGTVKTQHGILPVPAPAAIEVLRGYPVQLTSFPDELTTPTGAAIVRTLSAGVLDEEVITVEAVGYGAGTRVIEGLPNFLRIMIGEIPAETDRDELLVVETNIDDMNPQLYPVVIDLLLAAGAHDAYLVPIIMKKGRPGVLLSAMVERSRLDDIVALIYRETTTIGLRVQQIGRKKLPRRSAEVQTSFGPVRAKVVLRNGRELWNAEFEECRRIADERKLPVAEVMKQLEAELSGRSPT
jgi:hypothetical protein